MPFKGILHNNNKRSSILLDVPLVAQDKNNTCWFAAACMVSYYYRAGPRLGLPDRWEQGDTKGLPISEIVRLAEVEGLTAQPITKYHDNGNMYDGTNLYKLLQEHGPLWCAGFWFGPGHVIVLTGVDGNDIYFNDPDGGVKKNATTKWFNQKIAKNVWGHIMCKDKSRS